MKIELTEEQIDSLRFYLLITKEKRQEEEDMWKESAEEKQEGTEKQRVAESNADFFKEMNKDLEEIMKVLDNAEGCVACDRTD